MRSFLWYIKNLTSLVLGLGVKLDVVGSCYKNQHTVNNNCKLMKDAMIDKDIYA